MKIWTSHLRKAALCQNEWNWVIYTLFEWLISFRRFYSFCYPLYMLPLQTWPRDNLELHWIINRQWKSRTYCDDSCCQAPYPSCVGTWWKKSSNSGFWCEFKSKELLLDIILGLPAPSISLLFFSWHVGILGCRLLPEELLQENGGATMGRRVSHLIMLSRQEILLLNWYGSGNHQFWILLYNFSLLIHF